LHGYYLYLKGKYSRNVDDENNVPPKDGSDDRKDAGGGNPLSGLLGGYSSSSEESICPSENLDNSSIKSKDMRDSTDENNDDILSKERERKRKANRLEKLRIWKESRSG
jgi:hypothetical protein